MLRAVLLNFMMRITRQTLGSQDFPENPQKSLFESFSNANKKPSKNPKKTSAAHGNFEKPLPRPRKTFKKSLPGNIFMSFGL